MAIYQHISCVKDQTPRHRVPQLDFINPQTYVQRIKWHLLQILCTFANRFPCYYGTALPYACNVSIFKE